MIRAQRTLLSASDGVTAVEFGIIAPVFFMLLLGIWDVGHSIYARSVLQGAVQDAGRDNGIEGAAANVDAIDDYVEEQVGSVVPNGEFKFTRKNYREFDDVNDEEEFCDGGDKNKNGDLDIGDSWFDVNPDGFKGNVGRNGIGGANDIVLYTATVEYDHYFPLWSFIGLSKRARISASTTLRNQPYGTQAGRSVPCTTYKG